MLYNFHMSSQGHVPFCGWRCIKTQVLHGVRIFKSVCFLMYVALEDTYMKERQVFNSLALWCDHVTMLDQCNGNLAISWV